MLHVLALAYFVALLSLAVAVIGGMLSANRAQILGALKREDPRALALPRSAVRRRNLPRGIRMTTPMEPLRMAA